MRLLVELPEVLQQAVVTNKEGNRVIRISHLPRWYDIPVVEENAKEVARGRRKRVEVEPTDGTE